MPINIAFFIPDVGRGRVKLSTLLWLWAAAFVAWLLLRSKPNGTLPTSPNNQQLALAQAPFDDGLGALE